MAVNTDSYGDILLIEKGDVSPTPAPSVHTPLMPRPRKQELRNPTECLSIIEGGGAPCPPSSFSILPACSKLFVTSDRLEHACNMGKFDTGTHTHTHTQTTAVRRNSRKTNFETHEQAITARTLGSALCGRYGDCTIHREKAAARFFSSCMSPTATSKQLDATPRPFPLKEADHRVNDDKRQGNKKTKTNLPHKNSMARDLPGHTPHRDRYIRGKLFERITGRKKESKKKRHENNENGQQT